MLTTVIMAILEEERKKSGAIQYGLESLVAGSQLKINILSFLFQRKGIEPFSKTHTDHKGGMMRDLPLGYYADILLGSHSR